MKTTQPGSWMKARLSRTFVLLLLAPAIFPLSGAAQNYSLDWFKIAGGGGTSTNGQYSISGTIGQPDAQGPLTNGQYSVMGGFWSFLSVVQSSGAPTLKIVAAGPGLVTVSWSPDTPGYRLQEATTLSAGDWIDSPSGVANPVTVPVTTPMKYYRLIK